MNPFVKLRVLFRYYLRFLHNPKPPRRMDTIIWGKNAGERVIVLNEQYPALDGMLRNKLVQMMSTGELMNLPPDLLLGPPVREREL